MNHNLNRHFQNLGRVLFVVGVWLSSGCGGSVAPVEAPSKPAWFRDVTEEVHLDFVHDPGPKTVPGYFMPGTVGSGAAVFDFNNDERMDVLLLQNGGSESASTNRLFRQEVDGGFTDVSVGSGLDFADSCMGVAIGDVNNDGWPDVLITGYGRSWLFANQKDGTFLDVTDEAELDNPGWGTSACFVDFDRDGWLDLVIANYVEYDPAKVCSDPASRRDFCGPSSFSGAVSRLYHNLGNATALSQSSVQFEDITTQSGLGTAKGAGLGVLCADFNEDAWPDILVSNDGAANHLWVNQKDGTFSEEAILYGVAYNGAGHVQGNMGVTAGDLDGDGLFELFITHLPTELNVCWKQSSKGVFHDNTVEMGLARRHWRGTGFGTVFGDFDLDGALDIGVANGGVRSPASLDPRASHGFWDGYAERNQLFANDGNGKFSDVSLGDPFCETAAVSRGLVCADIDNDGALDLLVTRIGTSARLYRNVATPRGHWLLVRAIDPSLGGRDAYGATIIVEGAGRRWTRWVNPGYSYLCSNDPRVHFGLGELNEVGSIRVIWPDGAEELFDGAMDQQVILRKGAGRSAM